MKARLSSIFCLITILCGCSQIPNRVTPAEYSLYSEWTKIHFGKSPPERLYFSSRTGVFDPLDAACKPALEENGADPSLMNQIHSLGEAEYPLDFYSATNLQIPWGYKEVDTAPDPTPSTFHLITFSRVAFNRGHTEALFAFFDACAFSQCGHGGYVEAKKEAGNKWVFRPVGCVVVS